MRDYCVLDPRTELEQYLTEDLKLAFEKIGFQVNHNGGVSHSPGGVPDIEMFDDEFHFNIEATQLTGTNADREYPSITDHLTKTSENSEKKCFCIYVSPETSIRMIDRIKEFNNLLFKLVLFNRILWHPTISQKKIALFKVNKLLPKFIICDK